MELIQNYKNAIKAIFDHVGFKGGYDNRLIEDCTEMYWDIVDGNILFVESEEEFRNENYYSDEIYKHRLEGKMIYKGELFTLIICDDNTKSFRLFDNNKRIKTN